MHESSATYTNEADIEQFPYDPWRYPSFFFYPPLPFSPLFPPLFRPFPFRRGRHLYFRSQNEESPAQVEQRRPALPTPPPAPFLPPVRQPGQRFTTPRQLSRCLYRTVYIWPKGGRPFWMWPVAVRRNIVEGYRWREQRKRWDYFTFPINRIERFLCF
jgi:hypothetical protein